MIWPSASRRRRGAPGFDPPRHPVSLR